MDDRGVSPVVGKALEIGLVLLYVSVIVTGLYGGVVPEARATADTAIADRALSAAIQDLRGAVPRSGRGTVTAAVDLPDRIGGRTYEIVPEEGALVVHHPDPAIDAKVALLLPERVRWIVGRWVSTGETTVLMRATQWGVAIRLVTR